jgi:hypothetical protein
VLPKSFYYFFPVAADLLALLANIGLVEVNGADA